MPFSIATSIGIVYLSLTCFIITFLWTFPTSSLFPVLKLYRSHFSTFPHYVNIPLSIHVAGYSYCISGIIFNILTVAYYSSFKHLLYIVFCVQNNMFYSQLDSQLYLLLQSVFCRMPALCSYVLLLCLFQGLHACLVVVCLLHLGDSYLYKLCCILFHLQLPL